MLDRPRIYAYSHFGHHLVIPPYAIPVIMYRPITCKCKLKLGEYDVMTGFLSNTTIFGIVLVCSNCGFRMRFNGEKVKKKQRVRTTVSVSVKI